MSGLASRHRWLFVALGLAALAGWAQPAAAQQPIATQQPAATQQVPELPPPPPSLTPSLPVPMELPARRPLFSPPPMEELRRQAMPESLQFPNTELKEGLVPMDVAQELFDRGAGQPPATRGDDWLVTQYQWEAPGICHRPLYFEDVMLERHGHGCHPLVDPGLSAGRFFLTIPALPYRMWQDPSYRVASTLGHFRAGSPAPAVYQLPPWDTGAAAFSAGVATGIIFVVP